ncbi:hypothetical protein PsW64_01767 [Pseudovibrio sp. W64]|uniref:DMP19 family protein n=1 Tax=Pseudovibrio sp. W64 TaxID=1735583 RepID=UPI0007B30B96|nr:DUF4375 domain-containing protein [Pseudovibrio sp. W64]KZK84420.1 hypothetical protein PsW64_01767 [Pseudovibrio sp. W64]
MIKSKYNPNDPSLPLILPEMALQQEIYQPICSLVQYVRRLFEAGYSPDNLLNEYSDLYHLDFYVAQVKNGGNSQFIHNSFELLEQNLEGAARGARALGIPELADIVERCAEFCRKNPEEATRPDRYQNRAPELVALDKELYALELTEEERSAFFSTLPEEVALNLRKRFELPENLDEAVSAVTRAFEERLLSKTAKAAGLEALQYADQAFRHKVKQEQGELAAEKEEEALQKEIDKVVSRLEMHVRFKDQREWNKSVSEIVKEHFTRPVSFNSFHYYVKSFAWIACNPNLQLLPEKEVTSATSAIVLSSPFAVKEKLRRDQLKKAQDLEELTEAVPNDEQFSLAVALAKLNNAANDGPISKYIERDLNLGFRYRAAHLIETTSGEMVLCLKKNTVSLHEPRQSFRYQQWCKFVLYLGRKKLVEGDRLIELTQYLPKRRSGKLLARAKVVPSLPQLFKDLHLPEAVLLWTDHPGKALGFNRGVLDAYSFEHRFVTWRFRINTSVFLAKASPEGVHLSDLESGREKHFPIAMLKSVRLDAEAARQLRDEKRKCQT